MTNQEYADRLDAMVSGETPEHRASPENPSTDLANPASWLLNAFGGAPTTSGISISPETAMRLSAVYSCVRILAETIASLPLSVYERMPRGKRKATEHPLYRTLHDAVNPDLPSFLWREGAMMQLVLRGDTYAEIARDGAGRVRELYPLRSEAVTPRRTPQGMKFYDVALAAGGNVTLTADRMLQIPGLGYDGLKSVSVITYARNSMGLTTAAEEFGSRFLANGARTSGVLEVPFEMKDEAFNRLRDSFSVAQTGVANAGKPTILENGVKWNSVSVNPDEAQYLETRQFQIPEICRWFRVPPHLVYDLSKATFSNIEHQSIEFVTHSIRPWLVRWEAVMNQTLLPEAERDRYFIEFNVDGLLRGDMKTRYEAYAIGKQWGFLTTNMIMERENESIVDGGDVFFAPMNMVPAEKLGELADAQIAKAKLGGNTTAAEPPTRSVIDDVRAAYKPVFADALARVTRREVDVLTRASTRGVPSEFPAAVAKFYDGHAEYVRSVFRPAVEAFTGAMRAVGADAAMDLDAMAEGHCESRRTQVTADATIEQLATTWQAENEALAASMIEVFPHAPE